MNTLDAVKSVTLSTEDKVFQVDYFLTSGLCQTDGSEQVMTFGILTKLSIDGKITEISRVEDVTASEETAQLLIEMLAKNGVTPVSVKDVIEDFVAMQL